MNRFFVDDSRSIDDINAAYSGKTMAEISELEDARKEALRDEIDAKHEDFLKMDLYRRNSGKLRSWSSRPLLLMRYSAASLDGEVRRSHLSRCDRVH